MINHEYYKNVYVLILLILKHLATCYSELLLLLLSKRLILITYFSISSLAARSQITDSASDNEYMYKGDQSSPPPVPKMEQNAPVKDKADKDKPDPGTIKTTNTTIKKTDGNNNNSTKFQSTVKEGDKVDSDNKKDSKDAKASNDPKNSSGRYDIPHTLVQMAMANQNAYRKEILPNVRRQYSKKSNLHAHDFDGTVFDPNPYAMNHLHPQSELNVNGARKNLITATGITRTNKKDDHAALVLVNPSPEFNVDLTEDEVYKLKNHAMYTPTPKEVHTDVQANSAASVEGPSKDEKSAENTSSEKNVEHANSENRDVDNNDADKTAAPQTSNAAQEATRDVPNAAQTTTEGKPNANSANTAAFDSNLKEDKKYPQITYNETSKTMEDPFEEPEPKSEKPVSPGELHQYENTAEGFTEDEANAQKALELKNAPASAYDAPNSNINSDSPTMNLGDNSNAEKAVSQNLYEVPQSSDNNIVDNSFDQDNKAAKSKSDVKKESDLNGVGALSQGYELHSGNGKEHVGVHPAHHVQHPNLFQDKLSAHRFHPIHPITKNFFPPVNNRRKPHNRVNLEKLEKEFLMKNHFFRRNVSSLGHAELEKIYTTAHKPANNNQFFNTQINGQNHNIPNPNIVESLLNVNHPMALIGRSQKVRPKSTQEIRLVGIDVAQINNKARVSTNKDESSSVDSERQRRPQPFFAEEGGAVQKSSPNIQYQLTSISAKGIPLQSNPQDVRSKTKAVAKQKVNAKGKAKAINLKQNLDNSKSLNVNPKVAIHAPVKDVVLNKRPSETILKFSGEDDIDDELVNQVEDVSKEATAMAEAELTGQSTSTGIENNEKSPLSRRILTSEYPPARTLVHRGPPVMNFHSMTDDTQTSANQEFGLDEDEMLTKKALETRKKEIDRLLELLDEDHDVRKSILNLKPGNFYRDDISKGKESAQTKELKAVFQKLHSEMPSSSIVRAIHKHVANIIGKKKSNTFGNLTRHVTNITNNKLTTNRRNFAQQKGKLTAKNANEKGLTLPDTKQTQAAKSSTVSKG